MHGHRYLLVNLKQQIGKIEEVETFCTAQQVILFIKHQPYKHSHEVQFWELVEVRLRAISYLLLAHLSPHP